MQLFRTLMFTCCLATPFISIQSICRGQSDDALNPAKVDADFLYQGEYAGDLLKDGIQVKLGIQMVSQGSGKFIGVGYFGGLPGDGWTGIDAISGEGEIKNGVVLFTTEADVSIKDDVLSIRDKGGDLISECKKVIRKSPTLGQTPPDGAVVLFDGKSADNFEGGKLDGDLLVQGTKTKQKFQSYHMHLEFMLPYMPNQRGQDRGNSGCYAQGRYEVQILDSFGLKGEHNECGGIYEVKKPDVNMCFPPLSWQTFDIDFTAAKFDASGKKTSDARMTVQQNGVLIHNDVVIPKATRASILAEGPEPGPIYLQDHENPVRYRNIWVQERK